MLRIIGVLWALVVIFIIGKITSSKSLIVLQKTESIFVLYDRDGKLCLSQNNSIYLVDKNILLSGKKTNITEYILAIG